jgi:cytoskeletal protein CcmA (bactofilin family)
VAGNVEVGRSARIGNAKTVSGNIEIGESSRTGSLSSVAGRIRVGADSKVGGSIHTVAGDIEIARGCTITGDVGTVAGRITLRASEVKGGVTLTGGKLAVSGSRISGTLRIEHADNPEAEAAEVTIGADSAVAQVVVEKEARVHLRIHRTAKVGKIKGAEPEYYD